MHVKRRHERHHTPIAGLHKHFFQQYNTFVVVRDPYARCLSEFYCRWGNPKGYRTKYATKEAFNVAFRKILLASRANPLVHHWRPQHEYVFGKDGKQVVTHILRLEKLAPMFSVLMRRYGLPVRLRSHLNKRQIYQYTKTDFDAQSKTLIQKIYAKDFALFEYSM